MVHSYSFEGIGDIISPALIYYRDIILENTKKAIEMAGGASRLWPHVKSHKMADVIRLAMDCGITRFKCATIAEAEAAAACDSTHVVVAYPLVGPNIRRFTELSAAFPKTHFYATGDDLEMLSLLGDAASSLPGNIDVLVDVNPGMDRTGVPLSGLIPFCRSCAQIPGLTLSGLHCYDGHRTEHDFKNRKEQAAITDQTLLEAFHSLRDTYPSCSIIILGGTPSFPCHTGFPDAFFSPGTLFIYDDGYARKFPDLPYTPAAAILTRVVSRPGNGIFTLDLGYKGIAADPQDPRGKIVGLDHYEEMFQSEEHWTFRMAPGFEDECPKVGDAFFVIPTHICPTSALYPSVAVVSGKKVTDQWQVTARNRKITI